MKSTRLTRALLIAATLTLLAGCATPTTTPPTPPPTAPSPSPSPPPPTLEQRARTIVDGMNQTQRIQTLLIFHSYGTDTATMSAFVTGHNPGGLIFMGDNVGPTCADVSTLARAAQTAAQAAAEPGELPLLLAVDQEGGTVNRLPGDTYPAGSALHGQPTTAVTTAFTNRASIVADCGLNTNFGVIADTTDNPRSFIYRRSLGATPDAAAAAVSAAVTAETSQGILTTLKHFPGHGAAPGDSHHMIPQTAESIDDWRATDALPFAAGIDAGAQLIMFGHLRYTAIDDKPATMSTRWHEILRNDLGFDGIAISDDMTMLQNSGLPEYADPVQNAINTLNAGMTMLLYSTAAGGTGVSPDTIINGLVAAETDGRLDAAAIDDAAVRVVTQRLQLAN